MVRILFIIIFDSSLLLSYHFLSEKSNSIWLAGKGSMGLITSIFGAIRPST